MPESDRAELRRRRNKLSCPETIGEISHIARGDRESATTFSGVLDLLRGVIGSATEKLPPRGFVLLRRDCLQDFAFMINGAREVAELAVAPRRAWLV